MQSMPPSQQSVPETIATIIFFVVEEYYSCAISIVREDSRDYGAVGLSIQHI